MTLNDEEQLRAIWQGQAVAALQMTPEQLRTRAERFEATIRRRYRRDMMSFALLAIICACGMLKHGVFLRVGFALSLVWALLCIYTLKRFGAVIAAPAQSSAQTCAAYHQRQLERQRDIALSWPWGIGLVIPGFILVVVGQGLAFRHPSWEFPAVATAVFLFVYVAQVIYGKILARQWQREIDSLRSLRGESS